MDLIWVLCYQPAYDTTEVIYQSFWRLFLLIAIPGNIIYTFPMLMTNIVDICGTSSRCPFLLLAAQSALSNGKMFMSLVYFTFRLPWTKYRKKCVGIITQGALFRSIHCIICCSPQCAYRQTCMPYWTHCWSLIEEDWILQSFLGVVYS